MFWTTFWTTFGAVLEPILGLFWCPKLSQKVDPFLERLLVAIWRHFGRLLGCLGALLGGLVFQIYFKNQYKTALLKIATLRYRSSLGWLLEAMLAHFGEVLGPKMEPKSHVKLVPKLVPQFTIFWTSFGPIMGPFLGKKLLQKGTKNGTTFGSALPRISGVSLSHFHELYEWSAKATGTGIILSKRKRGIMIFP